MKKWHAVALLIAGATLLGATMLREPIASAAQSVSATIIGPLDAQGNVKVHEQGTAATRSADQEVSVHKDVVGGPSLLNCVVNGVIYTVPPGKDLVVEYVGSRAEGSGASGAEAGLVGAGASLPLVYQDSGFESFSESQSIHYTFPAGSTVSVVGLLSGADDCDILIAFGGYLQPSS